MEDKELMNKLKELICISIKIGQLNPNRSVEELYSGVIVEMNNELEKIKNEG